MGSRRQAKKKNVPVLEGRLPALTDASAPLGIEIEQAVAGTARRLSAKAPVFVLPLYSTVLLLEPEREDTPRVLDASVWLLVPKGTPLGWRCKSPVGTTLLLTPHPSLVETVSATYAQEVEPAALRQSLATLYAAPRTNWVNEVAQRYAFERSVCEKRNNAATTFLEVELLKEWFFIRQDAGRTSHVSRQEDSLKQAQAWIEAHLHEPGVTVTQVARAANVSPRALTRMFEAHLGMGPATYLRARRLEDALLLLRSGRYDVSEVAARVGYGNLSAFSEAFHQRFGAPPSRFRGR